MTIERTRVHIAGEVVASRSDAGADFEPRAVQRCAWCGEILINELVAAITLNPPAIDGVPAPTYPFWPGGEMVRVTDELTEATTADLQYGWRRVKVEWLGEENAPDALPEDACMRDAP